MRSNGKRGKTGAARAALLVALLVALGLAGCGEPEPVTRPQTLSVESPFRYPVALWDAGLEGQTVVMIHVTDVGGVDSVYVLEPSADAAFDSAAVDGAYALKFAPGRRGAERVAMWVRLPVRFRRAPGTGSTP